MRQRRSAELFICGLAIALAAAGCGGSPSGGAGASGRRLQHLRSFHGRCGSAGHWRCEYQIPHQARRSSSSARTERFDHVFATYKPKRRAERRQPALEAASSTRTARRVRTSTSRLQKHGHRLGAEQPTELSPGDKTPYSGAAASARGRTDDSVRDAASPRRSRTRTGLPAGYYRSSRRPAGPGSTSGSRRHAPAERRRRCRPGRSSSRRASRTTRTPRARCTASIRCGSSSTASGFATSRSRTRRAAAPTSSRGSRSPSAPATNGLSSPVHQGRPSPTVTTRRGLDRHGLLQRAAGRRAVLQAARRRNTP